MRYLIILISVVSIFFTTSANAAQTANATRTWDSSNESDIAKYIMHRGTTAGVYDTTMGIPHVPGVTRQTGEFLSIPEGQSFFVVTACDTSGNCSGFSNEVSKLIAIPPGILGNLGVTIDINVTITVP